MVIFSIPNVPLLFPDSGLAYGADPSHGLQQLCNKQKLLSVRGALEALCWVGLEFGVLGLGFVYTLSPKP